MLRSGLLVTIAPKTLAAPIDESGYMPGWVPMGPHKLIFQFRAAFLSLAPSKAIGYTPLNDSGDNGTDELRQFG